MRCILQVASNVLQFMVGCENTAAFVSLETPHRGRFSKNGFMLTPWAPASIQFYAKEAIEAADLQQTMSLTSLFESATAQTHG